MYEAVKYIASAHKQIGYVTCFFNAQAIKNYIKITSMIFWYLDAQWKQSQIQNYLKIIGVTYTVQLTHKQKSCEAERKQMYCLQLTPKFYKFH